MTIRPLEMSDLDQVVSLESSLFSNPWPRKAFVAELENQEICYLFVALHQEQIIGYYGFHLLFDEAEVTKVAVAAPFQRRGVATCLLNDLIGRLGALECLRVLLEVRVTNEAAINLYRRNQFIQIATRPGYYSDGTDALIMERRL